jgi:Protein of unknown function (DUF732)
MRSSTRAGMAVASALLTAAVLSSAPAHADENTDFVNQLADAGIATGATDPVALGQSICPMLVQPGSDFASAVSQVQNNGIPPAMAGFFAGLAIKAYCPQMMTSVADGTILSQLGGLQNLGLIPGL